MIQTRSLSALASRTIAEVHLSVSRYETHRRVAPHVHRRDQFCILLDGRYEATGLGVRQVCQRGDAVFHPAGMVHEDELFERRCTSLRIEFGDVGGRPNPLPGRFTKLHRPRLRELAGGVFEELRGGGSPAALQELASTILDEMRVGLDADVAGSPAWMAESRALVTRGFRGGIRLGQVARRVGMSSSQVAAGFRRYLGLSVGDLVQRLRIEYARERMLESDLDLASIAVDAGFSDQAHFSRIFHRLTGRTPGAWRRSTQRELPSS